MENLVNWLESNSLDSKFTSDTTFLIAGEVEEFLVILPKEDQNGNLKILDKDLNLNLSEEEKAFKGNYVFEFGGVWYYSKSSSNLRFRELRNIGKLKQENLPYVALGIHGKFDLMNGSGEYLEFCERAKFLGMEALGLAELNTLGGSLHFQEECINYNLKPILGERFTALIDDDIKIKLYIKDKIGWENILALNLLVNTIDNGIPSHPILSLVDLKKHSEGLILVIEEIPQNILNLTELRSIFKDNIFYQLSTIEWNNDSKDLESLNKLKSYFNSYFSIVPPVLLNDIYFSNKTDFEFRKKIKEIDGGFYSASYDQFIQSTDEIFSKLDPLFPKEKKDSLRNIYRIATQNTFKIVEACNFKIETGKKHLPKFNLKDCEFIPEGFKGKTSEELLYFLIEKGIKKRATSDKEIKQFKKRIKEELRVIKLGGFEDYFLIFWDAVLWCKKNHILTGPGRGSAAGALLSYLLEITHINPLKYDLLFQRFLNEGRILGEEIVEVNLENNKVLKFNIDEEVKLKDGNIIKAKDLTQEMDLDL